MNHLTVISNPFYTTQNRSIEPIDFIERWSLCRDLRQVIIRLKHATQTLHDDPEASLDALRLAWFHLHDKYLDERIRLSSGRTQDSILYDSPLLQKMRTSPFPMMAEAIAKEWGLSSHLKEVIFYITVFKNFYPLFPYMRPAFLKQALKHLEKEMNDKKQLIAPTTD